MNPALRPASSLSPSMKWSLYAGLYMFLWGAAAAFLLSDVLTLFGEVIGLPVEYSLFILASPSLIIGAIVWWTVVERRDSYGYLLGGVFGLATALLTGLLWVTRFVSVWGFEMLATRIISILVVFVLGVAVTVGAITGLPLMYARRLNAGVPSQNERTG